MGTEVYAKLIEEANKYNVKTIFDSSGEVLKLGIKARPNLIKPNLRELEMHFNTQFTSETQIIAACKVLIGEGVKVVITSLGGQGAILVTENKRHCVLSNLGELLQEEKFQSFIRIHRSYAVQKQYIQKIGSQELVLNNGKCISVGRSYKNNLNPLL